MHRMIFLALIGTACLSAALPSLAAKKAAVSQSATLANSGSTNTTGYEIHVMPSGAVQYQITRQMDGNHVAMQTGHIPKAQATKLFADIAAAQPLAQLPVHHGMKSVSFGTSTWVEYGGQKTPDLSMPADARGQALLSDITAIAGDLHLKNGPRRPIGSGPVPIHPG